MSLPVLYSFRRCPYAIRARMALAVAGITVELREVVLRDKPEEMIAVSAKGTVPVLALPDGTVIDESLDVMYWALRQRDPNGWLDHTDDATHWLARCDDEFKYWLDRYKYADRHPEQTKDFYRSQALLFIDELEQALAEQSYLLGDQAGIADVGLFPFIRQFAGVESGWWADAPYPATRRWLESWLTSPLFTGAMKKYPPWASGTTGPAFPAINGDC
jgi:glutathione S-transferase